MHYDFKKQSEQPTDSDLYGEHPYNSFQDHDSSINFVRKTFHTIYRFPVSG